MMGWPAPELYVVDVCGTLVFDDTTLGLLRHHFARDAARPLRAKLFNAVSSRRRLLWWGFAVAEKLTGQHLLKRFVVRLLAGERCEALDESAREYASKLLAERRIGSVWHVLEEPFATGRVVLASASLDPVVAALASLTGARYVASTLEQRDGILSGRYETDLTGQKPQALAAKYGKSLLGGPLGVMTDNASDRALVEMASVAYIVIHHASHRERWQGLGVHFIEINA
ncbi:haloacid dehalogenase-like hydrolase [Halomonas sp. M5N1S17]|uniref:haloacid dehalogenase-like hydrolase n=1 Tax=Halomonas alkalisoli TaxID=2907158 RepID=UPI001F33D6FF|nr:haloacid dehalogenase-like hydrolase [Halomonas alkalisoli]MCE9664015.1 haloacid dehalogenase-like hydrolase [Halomonas alkalisoli]